MHDLRLAIRILAKSPASTALSILSITLGIGLTAGLFSVVDAMFLRPLPIANPGEILRVASHADDGQELSFYGWPDYLDMRRSGDGLVTLVAYQRRASELYGADGNLWVLTSPVTANYFSVLGVRGKLG